MFRRIILSLFCLCVATSCKFGPSSDDALKTLESRGIPYTELRFLQSVLDGETEVVELFLIAGADPNMEVDVRQAGFGTPEPVYQVINKVPISLVSEGKGYSDISKLLVKYGANVEHAKDVAKEYTRAERSWQDNLEKNVEKRIIGSDVK